MDTEVWILGGTGRSGRVIATELMARGLTPVLVGRNPTRLAQAAQATVQTASEATFHRNIQPRPWSPPPSTTWPPPSGATSPPW